MPQIPRETVEQVLAATDIVDLIGSYLPIKRAGTRFTTHCPFHNEKTPSFSINPAMQRYYCFGCKEKGDAIAFVQNYEGLTFSDALRKLGERAGITIQERELDPREEADRRRHGQLLDLHRKLAKYYHRLLLEAPEAEHARQYLKDRGFTRETAEKWQIGWAPPKPMFIEWAKKEGLRGRDLAEAGILKKTERGSAWFYFRDRLMFPIANGYGDVIGFSGRQLEKNEREGKYVNTPGTRLFNKSTVLFGLDKARKGILDEKAVLICEGQIDAIVCHEHGIPNAIAPLGTAFPEQHARTLGRYTKTAILCYDSDTAGNKAVDGAFQTLAAEGFAVKVVAMPPGDDPDSYIKAHGVEAFRTLLEKAGNYFDFRIATAGRDLTDPLERTRFIEDCATRLAIIREDVSRDALVQHLATRLRVGAPELQASVTRARRGKRPPRRPQRDDRGEDSAPPPVAVEPAPLDRRIGALCTLALYSAEAREWLGEQFETLFGIREQLDGIPLLEQILTAKPDPSSAAAVNTFVFSLPEPQRQALTAEPSFSEALPDDPVASAEQTLADASAYALEIEDTRIKAALEDDKLDPAEFERLLTRMKEIAELQAAMGNRVLTNDRFAPNTRRREARKPWKREGFRDERKP